MFLLRHSEDKRAAKQVGEVQRSSKIPVRGKGMWEAKLEVTAAMFVFTCLPHSWSKLVVGTGFLTFASKEAMDKVSWLLPGPCVVSTLQQPKVFLSQPTPYTGSDMNWEESLKC